MFVFFLFSFWGGGEARWVDSSKYHQLSLMTREFQKWRRLWTRTRQRKIKHHLLKIGENYRATTMKTWNDLFLHTVCNSSFHFQDNSTLVSIHSCNQSTWNIRENIFFRKKKKTKLHGHATTNQKYDWLNEEKLIIKFYCTCGTRFV